MTTMELTSIDPNPPLIDEDGQELPTLSVRPRQDYRLDSFAVAIAPIGTACPHLTDIADGEAAGKDLTEHERWTLLGVTATIQTITDISLDSLMYGCGKFVRIQMMDILPEDSIVNGRNYSLVLAGIYELSIDKWTSRGVYIEDAEIVDLWDEPHWRRNHDATLHFRVNNPDSIRYLDLDDPKEPPDIWP